MKTLTYNRLFMELAFLALVLLISCEIKDNTNEEGNGVSDGDFFIKLGAYDGSIFGGDGNPEYTIKFTEPVKDVRVSMKTVKEGDVRWDSLQKNSETNYSIKMLYASVPTNVEITLTYVRISEGFPSEIKTTFKISEAIVGPAFNRFSPSSGTIIDLGSSQDISISLFGTAEKIFLNSILVAQNQSRGSISFNRLGFDKEGNAKVIATWTSAYGEREAIINYRAVGVDKVSISFIRDAFKRENIDNYRITRDSNRVWQLSGRIDLLKVQRGQFPLIPISEPPDEATSIVTRFLDGIKAGGPERVKLADDPTLIALDKIPLRVGVNYAVEYELRDVVGNITKAHGSFDTF
ncbi:hypothetical protein H8E77_25790 [bacterium]|nr:hypothetical protein [bacterium]